jgi:YVTN family beta-propeller protein
MRVKFLSHLYRYEELIQDVEQIDRDPSNYVLWNNLGKKLSAKDHYDDALYCFDKSIDINPTHIDAWHNKGLSLNNLGKYEEAITSYDRVLELEPNNTSALYNKGLSLNNLGKYEEAIGYYDRVLELEPYNVKTLSGKGIALEKLGRSEEALNYYDKISKAYTSKVTSLSRAIEDLLKSRKYEEAIKYIDNVLELEPNNTSALYNKGLSLNNLGKYEEAIGYYDRVLELEPNNTSALYNKGLSLNNLGKYEEAITSYDRVLELDKDNVYALIAKANTLFNKGSYAEAEKYYLKGYELGHDKKSSLVQLHLIYSRYSNQADKALEISQKLLEIEPQSFRIREMLAQDLVKAGRYKQGKAYARKALGETDDNKSQLILRFLIILSSFLDGRTESKHRKFGSLGYLFKGDNELGKFLSYYNRVFDPSFKIEEDRFDFKGFESLIEDNSIEGGTTGSTLNNLIDLMHGTEGKGKIGLQMADNIAKKNVEFLRGWKIILPIALVVVGIAMSSIGFYFGQQQHQTCRQLANNTNMLSLEGPQTGGQDIVIDPSTSIAYVINEKFQSITAIKPCTLDTTHSTGHGIAPAFDPTLSRMYMANKDDHSIWYINLKDSDDKPKRIPLEDLCKKNQSCRDHPIPLSIAVDPTTSMVYVAEENNKISAIDGISLTSDDIFRDMGFGGFRDIFEQIFGNRTGLGGDNNNIAFPNKVDQPISMGNTSNRITNVVFDRSQNILYASSQALPGIYAVLVGDDNRQVHINLPDETINGTNYFVPKSMSLDPNTGKLYVIVDPNLLYILDVGQEISKAKQSGKHEVNLTLNSNYKKVRTGNDPRDVVAYSDSNKNVHWAYVSNGDSDSVSVIDGDLGRVIKTIQVGKGPTNLAIDQKNRVLYVANENDIVHPITLVGIETPLNTIDVGDKPWAIDIDKNTHLIYVANYGDGTVNGTVSVINGNAQDRPPQNVTVGKGPSAISVDEKTNLIYVANYGDGTVSVINGNAKIGYYAVVQTIHVGKGPNSISIDNSEKISDNIYVANLESGTISYLNAPTQLSAVSEIKIFGSNNGSEKCNDIVNVQNVTASGSKGGDVPEHTLDGREDTKWSNNITSWIRYNFDTSRYVCGIQVGLPPDLPPDQTSFSLYAYDGKNWINLLNETSTLLDTVKTKGSLMSIGSQMDIMKNNANTKKYPTQTLNNTVHKDTSSQPLTNYNPMVREHYFKPVLTNSLKMLFNTVTVTKIIGEEKYNKVDFNKADTRGSLASPNTILFDGSSFKDRRMLWVTDEKYDWIMPIDPTLNSIKDIAMSPISVGRSPSGVAIDPSTKTIYVANKDSDTVSIVPLKGLPH